MNRCGNLFLAVRQMTLHREDGVVLIGGKELRIDGIPSHRNAVVITVITIIPAGSGGTQQTGGLGQQAGRILDTHARRQIRLDARNGPSIGGFHGIIIPVYRHGAFDRIFVRPTVADACRALQGFDASRRIQFRIRDIPSNAGFFGITVGVMDSDAILIATIRLRSNNGL